MSKIEARLSELGFPLPEVTKPVAAYTPAVITGNLVFTSGQLPFVNGALPTTGKVGTDEGLVDPASAKDLARLCALNALAAAKSVLGDLDRITVRTDKGAQWEIKKAAHLILDTLKKLAPACFEDILSEK